jgi:hypothetical protein
MIDKGNYKVKLNYSSTGLCDLFKVSLSNGNPPFFDAGILDNNANEIEFELNGITDNAKLYLIFESENIFTFELNSLEITEITTIPASQLNIGYDTNGNILTNPAIENGLNGGCDIVYPNNATLEALDTDNFLYTVGGIPIELSISDLQANWNNQFFWNTDNSTYAKQGLIYSVPVESNPIDKYYDGKRYLIKF